MSRDYEFETEATRDDVASVLRRLAEGVTAGSVRLGDRDDSVVIDIPETMMFDIELETEDEARELELELEWPHAGREIENYDDVAAEDVPAEEDEATVVAGTADPLETLARFEIFRDRGDEWRWRLVHRNGNVIATSGEGYTQKHNAKKGLRSVVQNAPGAEITDDPEE